MKSGKLWAIAGWTCRIVLAVFVYATIAGCTVQVAPARPVVYYRPAPPPPPPPPPPPAAPAVDEQLEQLVAPIALYPDPLLGVVLPAATFPQQVQTAQSWLAANPAPGAADIDAQEWDPSVKALVHYPTILTYMNDNADWTASLGSAFAQRQPDVFAAIQEMREQARVTGSLVDTPQQVVVEEGSRIVIEPADPAVVFVPVYDPLIVYHRHAVIAFGGVGFTTGVWLTFGFDWDGCVFIHGFWRDGWRWDHGWRRDEGFWREHRYGRWERDQRWGPVRHVEHYQLSREFRGHENEWHADRQRYLRDNKTVIVARQREGRGQYSKQHPLTTGRPAPAKPAPKPEVKPREKPEVKPREKPEVKPREKPEMKSGVKPEEKSGVKPEAKSGAKGEKESPKTNQKDSKKDQKDKKKDEKKDENGPKN